MLQNKSGDMTPFDMKKPPMKQFPPLLPLVWGGSWLMTRKGGLRIEKRNMKGLKPPFLVFSTHQGFADYYIAPLAIFPHRANYVSDMEGFAAFGEWLYRAIGCIGKRRYVPEYYVIRNIRHALKNGQSVVIFPESRHCNAGTTSYIPQNLGRLAKHLGVPVVTLSVHGSYLASPFWDESRTRKVPMEATLECICTGEALSGIPEEALQQKIAEKLQYDEYAWQREQQIAITVPHRAEGLHLPLYQCRSCGTAFRMQSEGIRLRCGACGREWEMDVYGTLHSQGEEIYIPDWYEWERANTEEALVQGKFVCDFPVRVEALPNARGFITLGDGRLTHAGDGFVLEIAGKRLCFPDRGRESVQTEYDYRGRGACIVLSDRDCCYYIYSEDLAFSPTELQFAGEWFYRKLLRFASCSYRDCATAPDSFPLPALGEEFTES